MKVILHTGNGDEFLLTGSRLSTKVAAPESALLQLVGTSTRSDMSVPGRPGVLAGDKNYQPIEVEIPFHLMAETAEEMADVYRRFRQGWRGARFEIHADHPLSPLFLDVDDASLPGLQVDVSKRRAVDVSVRIFSASGMFSTALLHGSNTVTVTNYGDVDIFPRIKYTGAGGQVTNPSGAKFTLEPATAETVINLDPLKNKTPGVLCESVKPGGRGVWKLPAGAQLYWAAQVADPWA